MQYPNGFAVTLVTILCTIGRAAPLTTNAPGWVPSAPISYAHGIGPWTNDVNFSSDGKYLAFIGASGEAGFIHTLDLKVARHEEDSQLFSYTSRIAFAGPTHELLVAGDSHVGFWSADDGEVSALPFGNLFEAIKKLGELSNIGDYHHFIKGVIANPRGGSFTTLAVQGYEDPVLWKFPELSPDKILGDGSAVKFGTAAYDPSGRFLIAGNPNLPILDADKNTLVKELLPGFSQKIQSIAASGPAGHACVAVAYNFDMYPEDKIATVEVLDFNSGKSIAHLEFNGMVALERQHIISLDSDCKTMLVSGFDQAILVDIHSGKTLATFSELLSDSDQEASEHQLSSAALSADGKMVALAYRKVMIFKKGE